MASKEDNNNLEEWKHSRDVLKTFDDRIHDLRKYGFTFITGLMAIEGILLPYTPASAGQGASGLPDVAKFGVLGATALLIIILRWFDGNYEGINYGASMRARVVERFLNLELTNQIAVRYDSEKLWLPRIVLYSGFEAAAIVLAFAILPTHTDWILYFIIAAIIESVIYYAVFSPSRLKGSRGGTDWTLDKVTCKRDEEVQIMVTNFYPPRKFSWTKLAFEDNTIYWLPGIVPWIIKDSNDHTRYRERPTYRIEVKAGFTYIWAFKPRDIFLDNGIYRIIVNNERSDAIYKEKTDKRELGRKLLIK